MILLNQFSLSQACEQTVILFSRLITLFHPLHRTPISYLTSVKRTDFNFLTLYHALEDWNQMPGVANRTFGNLTQSNPIARLGSIGFGNRT